MRKPRSPWILPDDGIIDPFAVHLAAAGVRRVRLTWQERRAAALVIVAAGGTAHLVAKRLHVSHSTARSLLTEHLEAAS